MDNISLWLLFAALGVIIYQCAKSISTGYQKHEAALDGLRAEIAEVREMLSAIALDVERVAYTPAEQEKKRFDRLPALTSESFVALHAGDELSLLLLTRTEQGAPLIFPVKYTSRQGCR